MSKPKTIKETLRRAYKLFRGGKAWLVGAESEFDYEMLSKSDQKLYDSGELGQHDNTFCMIGALREIDGPREKAATKLLADAILEIAGKDSLGLYDDSQLRPDIIIPNYNDEYVDDFSGVRKAFLRAIRKAGRKSKSAK